MSGFHYEALGSEKIVGYPRLVLLPPPFPPAMEAYPPEYVTHNLPLIVLSGLITGAQEHSVRDELREIFGTAAVINSDSPLVASELGQQLLQDFMSADGSAQAWSAEAGRGKVGLMGFKFKVIGRVSRLLILWGASIC